ncbi:MAG: ribonuclease D, partial [Gemmatimonadales bacterium]
MISPPKIPEPPLYIESETALKQLFRDLKKAPSIALDTEAASFHKYKDRIYLLQLSTPAITAVIDPLAVTDLSALGKLLVDPDVEVVFHDADYDLRLLDRDYGFRVSNIFDTRIAAQLLNEPGVGLGALLEKYVGVKPDKRFQRADWSARPLTEAMLHYAATDTMHLLDVRDILREQLRGRNRLSWAQEEFRSLESIRWTRPAADPDRFWRLKGAKALRGRSLAVLRELHEWRERVAKRADRAPFRIMNNEALIILAREQPRTMEALKKIRGVGSE